MDETKTSRRSIKGILGILLIDIGIILIVDSVWGLITGKTVSW
jgi:hypothetical protein